MLRTSASSSMTRIVNGSGLDGAPIPGVDLAAPSGPSGTRISGRVSQHAPDELSYLG